MPGRKPASVTPTSTRNTYSVPGLVANIVAVDASPHAIMIVPIHRRAPTRASTTLLGMPHAIYAT